ncbi:MAG: hypothetical protein IPQ06_03675 [Chitinophagaceae bacterium]|nr:hypothetical protein [Chitinophagaceae bacterium]
MTGSNNIQFVTHQHIDKIKWDRCIENAGNGLIYGFSSYLDQMAKNWDALVMNDYESVMPLTWNRKYSIHYLYQPFLTAQLGLFGHNNAALLESFLKAIPIKFKYCDIYLNHQNIYPVKEFNLYQRSNYVLDLNKSYDEIYNGYRENIKRNIKKAVPTGCTVQNNFDVEIVIELAARQMKLHTKESAGNLESFRNLYHFLHNRQMAITYGISSPQNEFLATCVFFFSHNRAYYILVGNHPDGKNFGASHALIDAFIKVHAGRDLLLDFEGSDIPNLAFFYSGFGAVEEKYACLKWNRLPFYLKWMKK